jgi:ParB family chromosome partitioning protein
MTAASRKQSAETVREIPHEQLFFSLEETRKTIYEMALKELADSIAQSGVIEALLVRSQALAPWSIITDGAKLDGPGFEIVAGQRRWLASKIAGKTTCPCIVRDMPDEEARVVWFNRELGTPKLLRSDEDGPRAKRMVELARKIT